MWYAFYYMLLLLRKSRNGNFMRFAYIAMAVLLSGIPSYTSIDWLIDKIDKP